MLAALTLVFPPLTLRLCSRARLIRSVCRHSRASEGAEHAAQSPRQPKMTSQEAIRTCILRANAQVELVQVRASPDLEAPPLVI